MNIIEAAFQSGSILYAVIHNPNGQVYNANTGLFETFNAGNWAQYAVPLTEQGGTGYYSAPYPAGIVSVLTTEAVYRQTGANPAQPADGSPQALGESKGVNVVTIQGDTQAAINLQRSASVMSLGTAVAGVLSTTQMTTDLPDAGDGTYAGRTVIFTSPASPLYKQAAQITAYLGATRKLTFSALTQPPTAGDGFVIV